MHFLTRHGQSGEKEHANTSPTQQLLQVFVMYLAHQVPLGYPQRKLSGDVECVTRVDGKFTELAPQKV